MSTVNEAQQPDRLTLGMPMDTVTILDKSEEQSDSVASSVPVDVQIQPAEFQSIHPTSAPMGQVPDTEDDIRRDNHIQPVEAGFWGAASSQTGRMLAEVVGAYESSRFDLDPEFDSSALIDKLGEQLGGLSPDEVKFMSTAKSLPHWNYLEDRLDDERKRDRDAADNTAGALLGSLLDIDIIAGATPIGAATKTGRAVSAATAFAGTQALYSGVGDGTLRTDTEQFWDSATWGASVLLAPALRGKPVDVPLRLGETTAPALPKYVETVSSVNKRWEAARKEAETVRLTNDELSSLDGITKGRGAAKRALQAQKRDAALAEVDRVFQPQLDAAAKAPSRPLAALPDDLPPDAVKAAEDTYSELMRIRTQDLGDSNPKKWIKNKFLAAWMGAADKMNHYLQGRDTLANRLYSAPHLRQDDVMGRVPAYENDYAHRLITVEDSIRDATQAAIGRVGLSRFNGKFTNASREVQAEFQQTLQVLDSQVLAYHARTGAVPTREVLDTMLVQLGADESINKIVRAWVDSGFSTKTYDDVAARGWVTRDVVDDITGEVTTINAMDNIVRRDTYLPVKHDYEQLFNTVRSGKATWKELELFIGRQIARMYPDLLKPKNAEGTFVLTEGQLGQHFIARQKDVARGLSDVAATGMNREQLTDLLSRSTGMSGKAARESAEAIYKEMHRTGTAAPSNLKRRIDWDWSATMRTQSGQSISMRDVASNNALGNVEDYARTAAHRNAMADFGIMSESQLENILDDVLDNVPEGTNMAEAKSFLKGTKDLTMGRAVANAPLPPAVRGLQAIADLFALANSGLLSTMELATQLVKLGVIRNFKGAKQGLRAATTDLAKLTRGEAKNVEDIISGKLLAKSKWKSFHTHYSDDVAVSGGLAESAEFYGQSARFLNGSETVKRFQTGILASTYVSELKGAMKGSKSSLKFFQKELEIDTPLLNAIQKEYAKHGTNIDDWASGVRVDFETKLFRSADNLALTIRKGEIPAFMEQSSVGKAIFPYLSFAFSIQNKVLRRTINKDGYTGLALLAAVQIPTSIMIAAAINVRKGKEWDDNLLQGSLQAVSFMGSFTYPIGMIMNGGEGSASTAFIPLSSGLSFAGELGKGSEADAQSLLGKSPLNAALPLHIVAGVYDELDKN